MSTAGKREGIKHKDKGDDETTRSGLFYEAIRIIKEMRETTHGKYPKYAIWENVYGAFSSNKGEDFRCVLEEFTRICDEKSSIPRPADGNGETQEKSWVITFPLHGDYSMLNTGECPNEENASILWQILQEDAPEKYYLSAKACEGRNGGARRYRRCYKKRWKKPWH